MPVNYAKKRINQTFPTAKMHECNDGEVKKYAIKFFEYWAALNPEQVELASVRIYRAWPVVDMKLSEPGRTRGDHDTLYGAIPFEPKDYLRWFVEKYGSGEWKCYLNEQGVHDSIIECAFSALDPTGALPKVDLSTVLWGNYKNASYRQMLKNNGIRIPGENPEQEKAEQKAQEQEEMEITAVSALSEQNKQLMEQNKDLTAKVLTEQKPVAQSEPNGDQFAMKATVGMVVDTARELVKQSGQGLNPSEMMDSSVKMIKSISELMPKPEKPDLSPMTEMMKLVMESQNKTLEKSERALERQHELELARINAAAKTPETAIAKTDKSLMEQVREAKELVDLLSGKRRRNGDDDEDEPKKSNWLELLLQNGPQIAGTLSPLLIGLATRFGLIPQPQPAPQQPQTAAVQQNGQQPQPQVHPLVAEMQRRLRSPELHAPELDQWIPLMLELTRPFMANFTTNGKDGYTFAEHLISEGLDAGPTPNGRTLYMSICENLGPKVKDGKLVAFPFYVLLQAHPELWPPVHNLPQQLQKFLEEFFGYDEMVKKEQEEAEGVKA